MTESYPLRWPPGWKRTENRERAKFGQKDHRGWIGPLSHSRALSNLQAQLDLLGVENIVLSTNLELRLDGLPKAQRRRLDDVGVAVYFTLKGSNQCIPCDKWDRIEDNMQAVAKTIEALRGIDRWGAKEMVDAAFRGFQALPAPEQVMVTAPRYFDDCSSMDQAKARFRNLSKELHPDKGGDPTEFSEMQKQYKEYTQTVMV